MIYNTKIENNQLLIKIIDNNNAHSMTVKLVINNDSINIFREFYYNIQKNTNYINIIDTTIIEYRDNSIRFESDTYQYKINKSNEITELIDKIITNLTSYINNFVAGRPNYYILMSYVNANVKPSWLTNEMISSYNSAQASLTAKNISSDDTNLRSSLEAIFTASINAGQTNDVTFNKIVTGITTYISSLSGGVAQSEKATKVPETAQTATNTSNSFFKVPENLPLAIGVGVGLIAIIYLWIVFI